MKLPQSFKASPARSGADHPSPVLSEYYQGHRQAVLRPWPSYSEACRMAWKRPGSRAQCGSPPGRRRRRAQREWRGWRWGRCWPGGWEDRDVHAFFLTNQSNTNTSLTRVRGTVPRKANESEGRASKVNIIGFLCNYLKIAKRHYPHIRKRSIKKSTMRKIGLYFHLYYYNS